MMDLKAKNKKLASYSVVAFTDSAWEGYLYWQELNGQRSCKTSRNVDTKRCARCKQDIPVPIDCNGTNPG